MTNSLHLPDSDPNSFALNVVHKLRSAGFEAVWAGGCVRDALLGIVPKDYDVATSARPEDVIRLFGARKTVAVGADFGVIVVVGKHKSDGLVQVATFRSDGNYSDGRRPDSIDFCSAEEDALRRDFTINGMFYDPVAGRIIDYVDGQRDLERGVIRAIGTAEERFKEDKLRMLRAARFAARFEFTLDERTAVAIRRRASELKQVSIERIAQELRRMFAHCSRHLALELLEETSLFAVIFPATSDEGRNAARRIMPFLSQPTFEPAVAAVLMERLDDTADRHKSRTARIATACREFKFSNDETSTICWLCDTCDRCRNPSQLPLHELKPLLADVRHLLLLDLIEACVCAEQRPRCDIDFLRTYLAKTTQEALNPPPLVTGSDLKTLGVKESPAFSKILRMIREEQLDEVILTRDEAIARARQLN